MAAEGNALFLQSFRFVFFRFRVDVWYWGAALIIRGLILASIPPLCPDIPHLQMLLIVFVMLVPLVLQVRKWPWKAPLLNVVDAIISGVLIFMLLTSVAFMDELANSEADAYKTMITVELVLLHVVLIALIVMAVVGLVKRGPMGSPADVFNLGVVPDPALLATVWKSLSCTVSNMDETLVQDACKQLPVYDLWSMESVLSILVSGGGSSAQGGKIRRKSNIQVFSNPSARNSLSAQARFNPKERNSLTQIAEEQKAASEKVEEHKDEEVRTDSL
jgi:hypothetical protein